MGGGQKFQIFALYNMCTTPNLHDLSYISGCIRAIGVFSHIARGRGITKLQETLVTFLINLKIQKSFVILISRDIFLLPTHYIGVFFHI